MAQLMNTAHVTRAAAPIMLRATAAVPSATRPSIGAALRFIWANSRIIAAEWVRAASGPVRISRARLSSTLILRRRAVTSGSIDPPAPLCALDSLMTVNTHRNTRADYAGGRINEPLTRDPVVEDF